MSSLIITTVAGMIGLGLAGYGLALTAAVRSPVPARARRRRTR